jgi:excisionase family DNA binding protein
MQPRPFEEFVRIYDVKPLNSFKRTCEILDCGHSKVYELVAAGDLTIVKDGNRSKISAEEIYERYVAVLTGAAAPATVPAKVA